MKLVPVIRCRDLARSITFYTETLDFARVDPDDAGPVIDVACGDVVLQLSVLAGDGQFGCAINVWVDDVDASFRRYRARGLDGASRPESTVHQGPVDQTWGVREFYATDPDGNTLCFRQLLR